MCVGGGGTAVATGVVDLSYLMGTNPIAADPLESTSLQVEGIVNAIRAALTCM